MKAHDKVVFIRGKKTNLRPLEKADAARCYRWINDREVSRFLLREKPVTMSAEEKWIESLSERKNDFTFAIETLSGVHIGNMGIHNINWVDGTAVTGAIIGEKAYWNKGFGTDAKMHLLEYAFNTLNLRKILSRVLSLNPRSIAYSKHCGYKEEGRLKKQIFRDGAYHDEVILALTKEDWLPYWRKFQRGKKKP